jgi:hypothetical protein
MSDGDGMTSSTQVPIIRCAWVPLAMLDTKCHHFSRIWLCWCLSDTKSPRAWSREPGYVLSRGDEVGWADRW